MSVRVPARDEKPARAVGYLRVSTTKQADEGYGLDVQEEKLRQYVTLYNIRLVGLERDEGESAKSLNRPGLQRALQRLGNDADALLVWKLDRLTRDVKDLATLIERFFAEGAFSLLSVSEQIDTRTASGRLVLNVLTSVGQWEREVIKERTTATMRLKRSRGEWLGGYVPYGYHVVESRLEPHLGEQRVIQYARRLRSKGYSLSEIGQALSRRGIMTRTGKQWRAGQVHRILQRETAKDEP